MAEIIDANKLLGKKDGEQDETPAPEGETKESIGETITPTGETATEAEPAKDSAPTPPAPEEEQPAPSASEVPKVAKSILITLKNGVTDAECRGVCPAEVWGMLHEAERLIKRQLEINEAMAFQQEMEKQALMRQLRTPQPGAPKPKLQ
jgi:hypothetical protein